MEKKFSKTKSEKKWEETYSSPFVRNNAVSMGICEHVIKVELTTLEMD